MIVVLVLVLLRYLTNRSTRLEKRSPNTNKTLCVFVYYENGDAKNIHNLRFFLKHGVHAQQWCDYIVVVNGSKCSLLAEVPPHVEVVFRANTGFNFGRYRHVVLHKRNVSQVYPYYIFLNTSVRGPFVRTRKELCDWPKQFLHLFENKGVHLVGCTINSAGHGKLA